jgi:hypothetical protein
MYESKKGCQPRNNLVKDGNGDLVADSQNTLNRWKKNVSQLFPGLIPDEVIS